MNDDGFNLVKNSLRRRKSASTNLEQVEPTLQEKEELFAERITPETELPPMQPLFQMFDVPCFYRGELVADCGKAKSGKTFFLSIIMAACLTQKALALERFVADGANVTDIKPLRVLWIDTEQSQQSTLEILRDRILPLSKGTEDTEKDIDSTFYAFNLRGLGFDKRQKMVDVAIRAIKPDIAIIDGIKDLMTDINDAVQATLIMEKLMALAKVQNCCIVCVLHQNKGEQDRNMRGSIGTELTNKAFEVFQCEMIGDNSDKDDTFKVAHIYSRKKKMKQKLYYHVNDEGLPELCTDYREQPRDEQGRFMSKKSVKTDESVNIVDLFKKALEGRPQRPFREVMAIALRKCGIIDASAFYAYFAKAEQQGVLHKEVHSETGETWVVLDDGALPF
ncbi:MAG: AAA family ATPase [Bacteroidaceae bacterium]|nr:AAA family ATPase [Bacteroidaceae bacterium]